MKSSEIFGGFIFLCYICINKKEQHYESTSRRHNQNHQNG